jgi:hypothetical protein
MVTACQDNSQTQSVTENFSDTKVFSRKKT